jgi:hypothetical protein
MFWISRDAGQRLGGGSEQDRIDHGFVMEGDLADRRRQREDDMKVRYRQQFGFALRQPLRACRPPALWAMAIAAGIVGDAGRATTSALLDMAAQGGRAARRDGRHDAPLDAARTTGPQLPECFAMAAENVRHLQSRCHGSRSRLWHDVEADAVERAWRRADRLGGDLRVAHRA